MLRNDDDIEDISEPPAENSSQNYREETHDHMNRSSDNDESSLKPSGRLDSDNSGLKMRKRVFRIATWNVQTLHQAGKYDNICKEMDSLNLDILGMSEVRWTESGKYSKKGKTMVYSGGENHQYGVGIMMTQEIASSMIGFWPMSDRMILMKLQGKPFNVNIIQIYAPTLDHSDEETDQFYLNLQKLMQYTKTDEINIIMGDFNAKVGNC